MAIRYRAHKNGTTLFVH